MYDPWEKVLFLVVLFQNNVLFKCNDPWEKGMFQDVDVKIQVRSYLNFDVDVLTHAFFP